MRKSLKAMLSAVLAVAAAFASTQSQGQGNNPTGLPNALNVNVTNTPLPVTGTVSGAVTITNQPNVFVTNSAANPVPVTVTNPTTPGEGAIQILQVQQALTFGNAAGACSNGAVVTVPVGKRFVITHFSAFAFLTAGTPLVLVGARTGASDFFVVVPTGYAIQGVGGTFSAAGQAMQVHTDTDFDVCVQTTGPINGLARIAVTGYYVDKN